MNIESIYITGLIGTIYNGQGEVEEKGVELVDVIQQVKWHPFADGFNVFINSQGGVFETGFEIFNYLEALKKGGKIINTIGVGEVKSIATVPFMAGVSRVLKPNTEFLIHLPMIGLDGFLNSQDLDKAKADLEPYEKQLIKFYQDVTGLEEEAVAPLVRKETILNPESAFDLKFATEYVAEQPKAVAYFGQKVLNNNSDKPMTQEDKNWLETVVNKALERVGLRKKTESKGFKVVALSKVAQLVNITTTDANGTIIDFPDVADGEMPKEGDRATIDGQPANGEYLMPDGTTYVFLDGALSQIVEATTQEVDVEALQAENESLKAQLATQATNFTTEITNLKAQVISRFEKPTPAPAPTPAPTPNKRKLLKD